CNECDRRGDGWLFGLLRGLPPVCDSPYCLGACINLWVDACDEDQDDLRELHLSFKNLSAHFAKTLAVIALKFVFTLGTSRDNSPTGWEIFRIRILHMSLKSRRALR